MGNDSANAAEQDPGPAIPAGNIQGATEREPTPPSPGAVTASNIQGATQREPTPPSPRAVTVQPASRQVRTPQKWSKSGAAAAVDYALAQVGKPYVWGGAGPDSFDCSGLVMRAWQAGGVDLPHFAASQSHYGHPVTRDQLRPGDLIFLYNLGHVELYIGNDKVVYAPQPGSTVRVAPLPTSGVDGYRRLTPPDNGAGSRDGGTNEAGTAPVAATLAEANPALAEADRTTPAGANPTAANMLPAAPTETAVAARPAELTPPAPQAHPVAPLRTSPHATAEKAEGHEHPRCARVPAEPAEQAHDRDRHSDSDRHGNTHADSDRHGNTNADRDRHGNTHADSDRHGDHAGPHARDAGMHLHAVGTRVHDTTASHHAEPRRPSP